MKPCALTGLSGLKTSVDRLAGGANLKLSGAKDREGSTRLRLTSVDLPPAGFGVFFFGGGLDLAFAAGTTATGAWALLRVDRASGAAVCMDRKHHFIERLRKI